jgi:hypothetical protein
VKTAVDRSLGTLDLWGGRHERWNLDSPLEYCFISSTLRSLTVHRCSFNRKGVLWVPYRNKTPLEELRLLDCCFRFPALRRVLATPTALKRLTLNQFILSYYPITRNYAPLYTPAEWLDAIMIQKDSLEYIELTDLRTIIHPIGSDVGRVGFCLNREDFHSFPKLKTLQIATTPRGPPPPRPPLPIPPLPIPDDLY